MIEETFIKVQVCELKVGIRCGACMKEVKKILDRIEGVYQTKIDAHQGKVTVIGQMDMETVLRKLKKAGKSAKLWDENPEGASGSSGASGGRGGMTNAIGVLSPPPLPPQPTPVQPLHPTPAPPPQPTPASPLQPTLAPPSQLILQQQIELSPPHLIGGNKTSTLVGAPVSNSDRKLDGHDQDFRVDSLTNMLGKPRMLMPMGMAPPTIGGGDKKVGGGFDIPEALMEENANHSNKRGTGMKQNLDAGGSQVKNVTPSSLNNNHGQAKKDGSAGSALFSVSGPMGDGMPLQQGGMTRSPHNMMGQVGYGTMGGKPMGHYPAMGGNGMQHGGGSAMHGHGHGMPTGGNLEMTQQVARNLMAHQPYPMVQPLQKHLMMSDHGPYGEFGHSGSSYQPMGYGYGHVQGQPPMQYLPPSNYPMPPPPHPHDSIFSDENPNNCLVM